MVNYSILFNYIKINSYIISKISRLRTNLINFFQSIKVNHKNNYKFVLATNIAKAKLVFEKVSKYYYFNNSKFTHNSYYNFGIKKYNNIIMFDNQTYEHIKSFMSTFFEFSKNGYKFLILDSEYHSILPLYKHSFKNCSFINNEKYFFVKPIYFTFKD